MANRLAGIKKSRPPGVELGDAMIITLVVYSVQLGYLLLVDPQLTTPLGTRYI
jgi:hypothetical protein